jgi:hypothetical protein
MWAVSVACALAAMGVGAGTEEVAPGTPIMAVRIERHFIYDLEGVGRQRSHQLRRENR